VRYKRRPGGRVCRHAHQAAEKLVQIAPCGRGSESAMSKSVAYRAATAGSDRFIDFSAGSHAWRLSVDAELLCKNNKAAVPKNSGFFSLTTSLIVPR
jgi:hypothetical protein